MSALSYERHFLFKQDGQIYFHRTIQQLLAPFFKAGLIMDALEELAFTEEDQVKERIESTQNYTQIPAILAFRARKAN